MQFWEEAVSSPGTQTPSPGAGMSHSRADGWLRWPFQAWCPCQQQIPRERSTFSCSFWISPSKSWELRKTQSWPKPVLFQLQPQCEPNSGHIKPNPGFFCPPALLTASALSYCDLNSKKSQIWSGTSHKYKYSPKTLQSSPVPLRPCWMWQHPWGAAGRRKRSWESPHSPHVSKEEQLTLPRKKKYSSLTLTKQILKLLKLDFSILNRAEVN